MNLKLWLEALKIALIYIIDYIKYPQHLKARIQEAKTMKLRFDCSECGKFLGYYEGEPFWLGTTPHKSIFLVVKTYCADCWKKERGVGKAQEKGVLDNLQSLQKQLREIVEDMKGIPNRRLPLGKNTWLHEWNEVVEKLEKVLGEG